MKVGGPRDSTSAIGPGTPPAVSVASAATTSWAIPVPVGRDSWPDDAPALVLIDNHDSFTYNLAQAFGAQGARVRVVQNDAITMAELEALVHGAGGHAGALDALVIAPGPGGPAGTGICARALAALRSRVPILGVCLGHQLIAEQLGAVVRPTGAPVHGKAWTIRHTGQALFAGLPDPFEAARYHSLEVAPHGLPARLRPLAWTEEGVLMGFEVAGEPTWGVQFHPESFLTPHGPRLLTNFLAVVRAARGARRPASQGAQR